MTTPYAGKCGYCLVPVTADEHGSFIDDTGSDRCSGTPEGTNEDGVHAVFDPSAGYWGVCEQFIPAHDPTFCERCFWDTYVHTDLLEAIEQRDKAQATIDHLRKGN